MELHVQAFWLPKAGNTAEEYEDAFDYSIAERRFAIADGATETSFSRRWARSLVQAFTASPRFLPLPSGNGCGATKTSFLRRWARGIFQKVTASPRSSSASSGSDLQEWLEPLQQAWHKSIDWENLQWFSLAKAQEGAFSSLLGLVFVESKAIKSTASSEMNPEECCRWSAVAIGDSCLFHVSSDKLFAAFPIQRAEQFNNRPLLLSSTPSDNQRVWEEVRRDAGDCQYNDLFILATDALAQWLLAQHEAGAKPWTTLCNLGTERDFASFITDLRQEGSIRNDDVTLLIVRLDPN